MDVKHSRETFPNGEINMVHLEPDPYEPDDPSIRYIEVVTKSGCRVCMPLTLYQSIDSLIEATERVLYIT